MNVRQLLIFMVPDYSCHYRCVPASLFTKSRDYVHEQKSKLQPGFTAEVNGIYTEALLALFVLFTVP